MITGKGALPWICESLQAITEDPMTNDRVALAELLQKCGDGDLLRAVAKAVLQLLMEADVE